MSMCRPLSWIESQKMGAFLSVSKGSAEKHGYWSCDTTTLLERRQKDRNQWYWLVKVSKTPDVVAILSWNFFTKVKDLVFFFFLLCILNC